VPSVVFLAAAAYWCLVLPGIGRGRSNRAGEVLPYSHWCRARPLFSELGSGSFVLDALVEACDDPAVPRGMPFSLRLVSPGPGDYLFFRLRASVEHGHPLSVNLEEGCIGRKARLCANGWMRILDVEHTSGWPSTSRS
jgi:hypothetical protein